MAGNISKAAAGMEKICGHCGGSFRVRPEDLAFLERVSPVFCGGLIPIPPPRLCPACRRRRRLAWRNERNLYRRSCDGTGQPIISNIAPDAPYRVYDRAYWFSDGWNPLDYGRDFDFAATFAENFRALQEAVPRFAVQQPERMENSLYCNFASNCKDCYFLFDSDFCRDCYYCDVLKRSEDCCDCSFTTDSELCYETINCGKCYNLRYARNCQNCSDSLFLESCIGCRHCAFCVNLHDKEYCFENKALSPEEYRRVLAALKLDSHRGLVQAREAFARRVEEYPRKYLTGTQNEDVSGDYISHSKNVHESFDIEEGWDLRHCDLIYRANNCLDVSSFGEGIEWMYECSTAGLNSRQCAFCFTCIVNCHALYCCDSTYACQNCFGCAGLHRREHCILNKAYCRAEYEKLAERIIRHMQETGEWGEFFPYSLSPYAYNETVAHEYFPLSRPEVEALGGRWREMPPPRGSPSPDRLPDQSGVVLPGIANETLTCALCRHAYRLTSAELKFYERMGIHLPRHCPQCRHLQRMRQRNERRLYDGRCRRCGGAIITTCPPDSAARVYCEGCWLGEVK